MFVREKLARGHTYLYLVESVREGRKIRQNTICALGRKDQLQASGELDKLIASFARHSLRPGMLADPPEGRLSCVRIGGPLLFDRLWRRLGIGSVIAELLRRRGFDFPVERAVFVSVLHRLLVSDSDQDCEKWMADYAINGTAGLRLHHFYRAMAWLGEELAPAGEGDLAPYCIKDMIEERLFERRRDLFSDLSLVFMDTTSLSFYGADGGLGAHGCSRDPRPDLKQMVLTVVIDGEGRPLCTEMMAGNTADNTALVPVIDRLRRRFHIGRVCVIADRGMISAATIEALEARKLDYLLGARERSSTVIRDHVPSDPASFTPLSIERARGETQLFTKSVVVDGERHIVCRDEAEAKQDRADRQAIMAGLEKQLKKGDWKSVDNSAYRRYLRRSPSGVDDSTGPAFEIDAGKLADEAQFDGISVLRTNTDLPASQAVLRYRELLRVEELFRRAKSALRIQPIHHSSDAAIRGHVFCSFLALVLQQEVIDGCRTAGLAVEWADLMQDLDRLQQADVELDDEHITARTPVVGQVGRVFQAVGVALPPNMRERAD